MRSPWKLPLDVVAESFQKSVTVAKKLEIETLDIDDYWCDTSEGEC